ncbi:MAG: tryptophan 2,3-dioxygenase [Alphaproteobacteria bacterium]|nr:tryptophan 2,3-dioxygenase [Alphaproteobacteria bacterium]
MTGPNDPPETGAHTDFPDNDTYSDYLGLDTLLACQQPKTDHHDEMMFVIIHQATELWMKLILHEVGAARACIADDDLDQAQKMLARISRIEAQLIQSWDVLSTLTPTEYLRFRDQLGQASGFQSWQYRAVEFSLGNKNPRLLAPHAHRPEIHARLQAALTSPSLYDEVIRLLARRGFAIAADRIERDWTQAYQPDDSVHAAWLAIYSDPEQHWQLYEFAEKLIDVEDWFQQWRFRHMKTVERIIGFKRGTGGTAGVSYLRHALDIYFFPELWQVPTAL